MQTTLDFTTSSPVNIDRMKGQIKRLYTYLIEGNKINCFSQAMRDLRIGYLNSRISSLRNENNIPVKDKWVTVKDCDGQDVKVKEYWIEKN